MDGTPIPRSFPPELRNLRGQFTPTESGEHIHILEYEAVFRALANLGDHMRDTCIRLWCDNSTVVAGLQKEYSSKPAIQFQLKRILALLQHYHSSLIVQYIKSADNTAADKLSRANLGDDF